MRRIWLTMTAVVLVVTACEYDVSATTDWPILSECNGQPATIGLGWEPSDGPAGATYTGTEGDDVVVIVNGPVTFHGNGGDDTICVNDTGFGWGPTPIVAIETGAGHDTTANYTDATVIAMLGDGNDTYTGGNGRDLVAGGPGDDTISTQGGNDVVWGSGQAATDTVDCGPADGGSGDLLVTDDPNPTGATNCDTTEAGGHDGDPILATTTAGLETEANNPANTDRSIIVWPGTHELTDRLDMPEGMHLVSATRTDTTTIDCQHVEPGPAPFHDNPYGCIQGTGIHIDALTVTDTTTPIYASFEGEYGHVGILLRNGGTVRDSTVTFTGAGIHAYVDSDNSTPHYEVEHSLLRYNLRGLKTGSTASGATVTLVSHQNAMHSNWATGHLVQSGVEGGSNNVWLYLLRENDYWKNGEANVWMGAGDEGGPSNDNRLVVYSINERATEYLGLGNDLGDYRITGAVSFGNQFPSNGNQVAIVFSGAEIGRLHVSGGADTDNGVLAVMSGSTIDVMELNNDPGNTVEVWGSQTSVLAANTINQMVALPPGEDICSFFTEGC